MLSIDAPLSDGYYRTDLLFGSDGGKAPLLIAANVTKEKMQKAKIKGLSFSPVYSLKCISRA
jgi:hypothetical protein